MKNRFRGPDSLSLGIRLFSYTAFFLCIIGALLCTPSKLEAAAPPSDPKTFGLLAAGERTSVIAPTTGNITTNNNGSEWYYRNSWSMGFANGGDPVSLNSCDIMIDPNSDLRMCWHTGNGEIQTGYKAGNQYSSDNLSRYIYQSNTLPTYYPSGPQTNVTEATVTGGGWTLCWSGKFSESGTVLADLFANSCTGSYLMYAASPSVDNLMDVTRDGSSLLYGYGQDHNQNNRLNVGDTINFELVTPNGNTPIPWSHYKVYISNCVISDDCSPGNPMSNPGNWSSGTPVSNGAFTVPENADSEQLYIYQADDTTGDVLPGLDSTRMYVAKTPVDTNISTCEELAAIDDNINASQYLDNYTLTQDIDCTNVDFGMGLFVSDFYRGTFDGQGHIISNLTINSSDDYNVGLFSGASGAIIKNVKFDGGSITGDGNVGSAVGSAFDTIFENIQSNLDINGNYQTGGLVGYAEYANGDASLHSLSYSGAVQSGNTIGGLFGELDVYNPGNEVTLSRSFSEGSVASNNFGEDIGGLIGYAYVSNDQDENQPEALLTVEDSYSTADMSGSEAVGGIIGYSEVYNDGYDNSPARFEMKRVYSSGAVSADSGSAGGLVGRIYNLYDAGLMIDMADSFAVGEVTGQAGTYALVGGDDGWADYDGIFDDSNLYFDITATGQNQRYYQDGAENGFGKNESGDEPNYFLGNNVNPPLDTWDFENVWKINAGGLPTFLAQPIQSSSDTKQLISAENGKAIQLSEEGCGSIDAATVIKEVQLSSQDAGFDYPAGLVDFTLAGCQTGGTATITMLIEGTYDTSKLQVRKYNPVTKAFTTLNGVNSGVTIAQSTLNGQPAIQVTYQITDGGVLDADGAANGTIVDPAGVALLVVGAPNTGLGGGRI